MVFIFWVGSKSSPNSIPMSACFAIPKEIQLWIFFLFFGEGVRGVPTPLHSECHYVSLMLKKPNFG